MEKQKNTPIFYFCIGKQIVSFKNETMDVCIQFNGFSLLKLRACTSLLVNAMVWSLFELDLWYRRCKYTVYKFIEKTLPDKWYYHKQSASTM